MFTWKKSIQIQLNELAANNYLNISQRSFTGSDRWPRLIIAFLGNPTTVVRSHSKIWDFSAFHKDFSMATNEVISSHNSVLWRLFFANIQRKSSFKDKNAFKTVLKASEAFSLSTKSFHLPETGYYEQSSG